MKRHPKLKKAYKTPFHFTILLKIVIIIFIVYSNAWAQSTTKKVIVGVLENWPPQYSFDHQMNTPTGFAIEVFEAVANRADLEYQYRVFQSWPELILAFKNKAVHIIPNIGITSERKNLFDFTISYETSQVHSFVRQSTTNIKVIEDLKKFPVGVVKDNKGLYLMKTRKHSNLHIFSSLEQALLGLLSGEIDALVYPELPVRKLIQKSKLKKTIKIVGEPLFEVKRAIGVFKSEPELLSRLNLVLSEFIKTESYQKIYVKWFGKAMPYWTVNQVLIYAALFGILIILILLIMHYRSISKVNNELKSQVAGRTEAEESLKQLNKELESRIQQRTSLIEQALIEKEQALTEKEKLLLEIQQRKKRFEQMAELLPVGIVEMDSELKITYLNKAGFEILEYTEADLEKGINGIELLHPNDREKVVQHLLDYKKKLHVLPIEYQILTKSGSAIPVLFRAVPIYQKSSISAYRATITDISDLRQSEDKLRDSEALLSSFTDALPDISFIFDEDGNYIRVFATESNLLVMEAEKLEGKNIYDVLPNNIANAFLSTIQDTIKSGQPKTLEYELKVPAGEEWFQGRTSPMKMSFNDKSAIVFIAHRITARKQAEKALKENEERFKNLVNTLNSGVAIYKVINDGQSGSDYIIQDFNHYALQHEGLAIEDIITKSLKDIRPNIDDYGLIDTFRKVWKTGEYEFFQAKEYVDEKYSNYYENRVFRLPNDEIVAIYDDVTTQMRAEEDLKESEVKFRSLVENINVGVALHEIITDKNNQPIDFTFLNVNPAYEEITHLKAEKIVGQRGTQVNPDLEKKWIEAYGKVAQTGESITIIDYSEYLDKYLEVKVYSPNENQFAVALIDITKRKQTEAKIEAALKEKETLLQEIHHRVKNNMTVVSSLLQLHGNSVNNKEVQDALKESQGRIYAMSAVHEILHNTENLSEIDLSTYLRKLTNTLLQTYSLSPSKIQLKVEGDEVKLHIEKASPLGLTVNELISNALKYAFPMERKGEITINISKQDKQLLLIIKDDGIGVPDGFDWRNSDSLGLKLVRTLVENQLDGSIDMESDKGTKFIIKFNIENEYGKSQHTHR